MFRYDFFDSTHIWLQCFRDIYTSVCIQVIFQEGNQHSRRRNYSIIQSMCEILTIFTIYTDFQSSCLCITQVGAASYFKVFLLSWRPCLYIDGFYFQISQITGTAFQSTNRDIQGTEQLNSVLPQLSNHILLSSGLQTTIISCFSN